MKLIKSVWSYRDFILGSVKKEFQFKYMNSLLGPSWAVINPLAMIIVYTVIFSQVMRAKVPGGDSTFGYSIYLCAGILSWGLFNEIVSRAQYMFLENANLMKKIKFPKICIPTIVVINAMISFLIIFGLFSLFLLATGNFPGVTFLALIPLLIVLIAFAIGLGMTLGIINVFFRDVAHVFGIFLQFWFWLTPIVYPINALPDVVANFMVLNPMAPLIAGFQNVLVLNHWPNWVDLLYPLILAALLCLQCNSLLHKHGADMMDEL
jgi:lipopolysaccharide transport system permease protein